MEATGNEQARRMPRVNMFGGWTIEALGGAAGAVLAIIGLSHVEPAYLVAVAGIALGAALLFQGSMVTAEYASILQRTGGGSLASAGFGGGLSAQSMAGAASIILSLLALLGLPNVVLMGVVSIVLGAGLILNSGVNARLDGLKIEVADEAETAKRVAQEAVSATTGADIMVGLAAVVLGILALIGIASMVLNLTAMLAVGTAILFNGSAVGTSLLGVFMPVARR